MSSAGSDSFPRHPHLPPELIYCILENCNEESLPNCSLVCRTWHSITAPLLYSQCYLRLEDGDKNLSDFLSFFQEGAHLACHVKSFKVKNGQSDVYQLARLFDYFPHLRDLAMGGMVLTPALVVDSAPSAQPSLPIPHLKSLSIHAVHIVRNGNPWSPLFDLINSFSVINKLVLESLWSRGFSTGYRRPPSDGLTAIALGKRAKIGELVFLPEYAEDADGFVSAITEHLDVTQIHTLETTQWYDRYFFEHLIAMFEGVKHFRFLMRESYEGYFIPLPASRSFLESITFSMKLPERDPYAEGDTLEDLQEMFSASLEALSSISRASKTQLATIRYEFLGDFTLRPGELDNFRYLRRAVEDVDWPNLESILSKDTFGKLRVVEVLVTVPEVFPDDCPDEMSITEYHAKEAKERAALVDIVKDRLPNLMREYMVNVWVRDA